MSNRGKSWALTILRQGGRIAELEAENERLRSALEDIEVDYNINEGAEDTPITPGHKRCVDIATRALSC